MIFFSTFRFPMVCIRSWKLLFFSIFLFSLKQCFLIWIITGFGSEHIFSLVFQFLWGVLVIGVILLVAWEWWIILIIYFFSVLFQLLVIGYWIYTARTIPLSLLVMHVGEVTQGVDFSGVSWSWYMVLPVLEAPLIVYALRSVRVIKISGLVRLQLMTALMIGLLICVTAGSMRGQSIVKPSQSCNRTVRGLGIIGWWINDVVWRSNLKGKVNIPPRKKFSSVFPGLAGKVVVIQVESLDAAVVNYRCNGKSVAPNLARFAKKAWYFPRIKAEHLSGGSSDADAAFILGAPARSDWPVLQSENYDLSKGIGHEYSMRGLSAVAYHNNSKDFFSRGDVYKKLGFEKFMDPTDLALPHKVWGSPDHLLFPAILKNWGECGIPSLSFIITLSSHHPFTMPRKYGVELPWFDGVDNDQEMAYLQSIWYMDSALGAFVDKIDTNSTWVIIYGDHCPGIPQDRVSRSVATNESTTNTHCQFVDSSFIDSKGALVEYVPLIILGPGPESGLTVPADWSVTGQLDLGSVCLAVSL